MEACGNWGGQFATSLVCIADRMLTRRGALFLIEEYQINGKHPQKIHLVQATANPLKIAQFEEMVASLDEIARNFPAVPDCCDRRSKVKQRLKMEVACATSPEQDSPGYTPLR